MQPWPDTLLVEHDLDTVRITLGPSQRITAWGGLAGILGSMAGGGSLIMADWFVLGGTMTMGGVILGGWARVRGWVREEAPLVMHLKPHQLELRRVYRQRLLHVETVPFDTIHGCRLSPGGLTLVLRGGERRLVTGFRAAHELQWVSDLINARVAAGRGEADPRLEALQARKAQQGA